MYIYIHIYYTFIYMYIHICISASVPLRRDAFQEDLVDFFVGGTLRWRTLQCQAPLAPGPTELPKPEPLEAIANLFGQFLRVLVLLGGYPVHTPDFSDLQGHKG